MTDIPFSGGVVLNTVWPGAGSITARAGVPGASPKLVFEKTHLN